MLTILSKMASNIKRYTFSQKELLDLQETLQIAKMEVEKAQKELAEFKLSKISLQQKHNENNQKYR